MNDKLTPRQNEIISEALAQIAVEVASRPGAPETLDKLRHALVDELKAVTASTDLSPISPNFPNISG